MASRTIKIYKKEREQAELFADRRCGEDQSLYQKRGSFKREDILIGALAEIGAYKLLRKYNYKVTKPDFSIHTAGNKSYESDLTDYDKHFHVKGQSLLSTIKYGASWLMQRKDPLLSNPPPKHYLIPTTVDLDANEVEIHGIIPFKALIEKGCIGECSLEWFRKTKVAIYKDYIDSVMSYNSRWGLLWRGQNNG